MKTLVIRPKDCIYCGNLYYGLYHLLESIKGYNVTELQDEDATRDNILSTLSSLNPDIVIGGGHGSPIAYTANQCNPPAVACVQVFNMDNCGVLAGKKVHLLSCLTAISLGPEMIKKGVSAYSGYRQEWYWITEDDGTNGDPYQDKYAYGFFHSDNVCSQKLVETGDMSMATQTSQDEYDKWIKHWLNNPDNDPHAIEIAKWLIWNKEAYVDLPATITQPPTGNQNLSSILKKLTLIVFPVAVIGWLFLHKEK